MPGREIKITPLPEKAPNGLPTNPCGPKRELPPTYVPVEIPERVPVSVRDAI